MIKDWLGASTIRFNEWDAGLSIEEWWTNLAYKSKAMVSVTMLVSWTIWKERNARVFNKSLRLRPFFSTSSKMRLGFGSPRALRF